MIHQIPETDGPFRLGRHVLHDPRSKEYNARSMIKLRPLVTTIHECVVEPWDQGEIGSCTANAALGTLVTAPNTKTFTEHNAIELYKAETRLDDSEIPGHWEPDDTGSTGLWSMKSLHRKGLIKGYKHAFELGVVQQLLLDRAVSTGITWYQSMFDVDSDNTIKVDFDSDVAGGHQICLVGLDVDRQAVRVRNSWGTSWADNGYAWLEFSDYEKLLADRGDAVVPVL